MSAKHHCIICGQSCRCGAISTNDCTGCPDCLYKEEFEPEREEDDE